MKIINKIIETILNIIIVIAFILVILAVTYITQTQLMHKEYANIFGYTCFEVITGSMSGTIEIGDVVVAKLTDDVQENDIIVYKQDENFITHRVISINDNEIVTKGDANNSDDKKIEKNQVLGKVIKIIPKVSIWKKVLSTPIVAISIIVTILLFGFAFSYQSKDKEKENKNDKQEKS